MTKPNPLIVLIVREAALRSSLAAQLSFAGYDLITAPNAHDPGLQRSVRRRAALVIEESLIAARSPEWIGALLDDWWRVVVITAGGDALRPPSDDRQLAVDAANVVGALAALGDSWRTDPPQA